MNAEVAGRREWVLAEQPGRDVTRVVDCDGEVWNRRERAHGGDWWSPQTDPVLQVTWSQLLVEYGPLTDATPVGVMW